MMQSNDICDYCKNHDEQPFCYEYCELLVYNPTAIDELLDYGFKGIEVEPVVRCKDCKHALFSPKIKEGFCYCELTKAVPLTHFCGWGIPK